jgi:hypothetical protein
LCHGLNVRKLSGGTNTNHVVAANQMLDGDCVAKASSLNPWTSLLNFEVQMSGRNV